uniref:NAD-dependent epimerase/dehydratase domain-containing protein n=1 Tax=Lotharella oceanica TaxID=641309 RepID=A0A7S2XCP0_9EUKA|mmetsp:Transcript_27247/g.50876  ORF Transcript_27247/g.50876 Transcript_27247/m.50876 type:complete len:369 (+) Transcript_27247:106-1212(+)|eukprot:CAMPEP_0170180478 /NCGR_PEP_ID=MMETSP0040_2-20121228/22030_1 /TAXON_ID=641309 /ORGANISM="Lotharella oceanica, Strain CCMP622" /LENGTH=368 /DNA_ID=CAMNT_0010425119 /DNA_START=45 /DNA_END=1151 /DNA_ORIENTATION=+
MSAYKPRAVLITGAAGFIGSNVCIHCVKNHPEILFVVFDKMDYCANLKNLEPVHRMKNYEFVKGDILSADLVNFVIKRFNIDTIFHFAAQTHVDNSFGNSLSFTQTNVLGTHTLLECWRSNMHQVKRYIHVSTDEVYGENKVVDALTKMGRPSSPLIKQAAEREHLIGDAFEESKSMLLPTNPYAASKAAAEMMVRAYVHSFGLPAIITRGNNVYGPRQYPEKLIPKFIYRLERKQKLCVHGKGTPKRSYMYVEDAAEAYRVILFHGKIGEVYNVGVNREISVMEVTKALLKAYGLEKEEEKWIDFVSDRHFNDQHYYINTTKLENLGWKAKVRFEDGLKRTIEWYRANTDHWEETDIVEALVAHPRR